MAIITISRGTASGGKLLAECISEKLGYPCIPPDVLVDAGIARNVPYERLKKALDKAPGFFDRKGVRVIHYLAYIREALVKAVQDEHAVYYGMAGQVLLSDLPHVLRVFVIAGMEYRIQAAMARYNINREKAEEILHNADKKRDKWVKHFYNIDRRDPSLYDLVINLDHISIESACDTICTLASQKEFQPSPGSRRRMDSLLLSTKVRSIIAAEGNVNDDSIEVEAEGGTIILKGTAHSMPDADRIRELVHGIPGVTDIKSEMRAVA